jgi:hypothetical protein
MYVMYVLLTPTFFMPGISMDTRLKEKTTRGDDAMTYRNISSDVSSQPQGIHVFSSRR